MTLFQYAMTLIHMKEKVIGGKGKKPTIEKEVEKINIKNEEEYREQFTWSWTL